MKPQTFHLPAACDRLTLSAALKRLLPDRSWSQVRELVRRRQVQVNGNLCLDEARKVKAGDVLQLWPHPLAAPAGEADVRLAYVDAHLVVVHKPAGLTTLRHREEHDLPERRKQLQPTLDELVQRRLAEYLGLRLTEAGGPGGAARTPRGRRRQALPRAVQVRAVHRLDRDTSGVMLFARTPAAEQALVRMFARHEVKRAYVAVVHGRCSERRIESWLVRDRGDGLRGSSPAGAAAEGARRAVTHVRPLEHLDVPGLGSFTVVECRLETGRTHQIRIHLAESGHRLCGEKVYTHALGEPPQEDASGAPRQALHAAELALVHPLTGQTLRFLMPLPEDLRTWLLGLRRRSGPQRT